MLSLFPELLFLAPLAAFLIRLSVAAIFAFGAYGRLRHGTTSLRIFGAIDALLALAFALGLYTQPAALIGSLCLAYWLIKKDVSPLPRSAVALALIMALTLLLTGPGPFAFDLPL